MIDRAEILRFGDEFGLEPRIVEKDYVLGWVLAGIYRDPNLAGTWYSKAGLASRNASLRRTDFPRIWILRLPMRRNSTPHFWRRDSWSWAIGFMKRRVLNCLPTSDGLKYMTTGEAEDAARDGLAIAGR